MSEQGVGEQGVGEQGVGKPSVGEPSANERSVGGRYPGYEDRFGMVGPLPNTDGQRQPLQDGDSTGPEVGERLPDFTLPSALGRTVSFHEDRAGAKAAVVFYRSAVW